MTVDEVVVEIDSDEDLVPARAEARALALRLGFSRTDATLIATAISEIARNIVVHVGRGSILMRPLYQDHRYGLVVIATDDGPGIRDVEAALAEGNPSRGGLGLGLPGARRLMDEFEVVCGPEQGTTVTMTKWRMRDELERLRERRRAEADGGRPATDPAARS
jgi:serine/threonine-protein kinase RsbT